MKKVPTTSRVTGSRHDLTPVQHFRLSRAIHSGLKVQAAREGRAMYHVVGDAIREYVARHRPRKAAR